MPKNNILVSVITVAIFAYSSLAFASNNNVVTDSDGDLIKSTFGNCVRTKWESGVDKCAGAKPAAKPVTQKRPAANKKMTKRSNKSRAYLVFFNFDSSDLTDSSKDILSSAYKNVKGTIDRSFQITGHADKMGGDQYNMFLSKQRANSVRDYLVNLGLDNDIVKTKAKGEASPLVATADGIAEPQNRRVEVVFSYEE